ncbi:MAG TPA: adenylyl-sulfate kinase [Burkholderiales bacterium]|jgi:adenylylsulfate kinase|nr:adenylyl-sulfate kinase [Burkholderiales bacterium]
MSFAVWLTGLSGAGKSAIAKELLAALHGRGVAAAVLESDVLRTQLTPFPTYEDTERDEFYQTLSDLGAWLVSRGKSVIIDATANRRAYRDRAREAIARFAEVYVSTPLEVCAARDTKGLYKSKDVKALPGLQAPYEPPVAPELVISGAKGAPRDAANEVMALLGRRGWI